MSDASRQRHAGATAALLALALRLSPWKAVFSPAGTLFVDPDDWHHLRRLFADGPAAPDLRGRFIPLHATADGAYKVFALR